MSAIVDVPYDPFSDPTFRQLLGSIPWLKDMENEFALQTLLSHYMYYGTPEQRAIVDYIRNMMTLSMMGKVQGDKEKKVEVVRSTGYAETL